MMVVLLALLLAAAPAAARTDSQASLEREAARQTRAIVQGGRGWPVRDTRFFRIRHQDPQPPDPAACAELDRFTSATLAKLGFSPDRAAELARRKLDYYLCDDATVQRLTGYPAKGMADLRGRAVISSQFPHFHELAHLLVDLTFETTPAQTLPLVQEGLACLLGGRWGRSPEVVLYTGWVNHHFGMGDLQDVLTQDGFSSCGGGADTAYALGALLCETVRREAGWPGVLALNRSVAGDPETVSRLGSGDVVELIARACGRDADDDLDSSFATVLQAHRRCGLAPLADPCRELPPRLLQDGDAAVHLETDGDGRVWGIVAPRFPVFVLSEPQGHGPRRSDLFDEHLPGHPYRGQRWGLRCSPDALSLYDFATNRLVATWVAGFTDEVGALACDGGLLFREELVESRSWLPAEIVIPAETDSPARR